MTTDAESNPSELARRTRWRAPATIAVAVVAVAAVMSVLLGSVLPGGVGDTNRGPGPRAGGPTAAVSLDAGGNTLGAEAAASSAATGPGDIRTVPAAPQVGVGYPFDLLTHCGIVGAIIGGIYFVAESPLIVEPAGPPSGWDNPYQRGTLTLVSPDIAEFLDAAGHVVRFRADPGNTDYPICD